MKLRNILNFLLIFALVALILLVGLYFLNVELVERDLKQFHSKRKLKFDKSFVELDKYLDTLGHNKLNASPEGVVRQEFNDCHAVDSTPQYNRYVYRYKLGLWGKLEIRARFDSLARLKDIAYYYRAHKYDY